jgi:hypothetical protein
MTSGKYHMTGYVSGLAAALTLTACGDEGRATPVIQPQSVIIGGTHLPLMVSQVRSINGTYGEGCAGRSGNWSVAFQAAPGELAYDPLSILQEDEGEPCELRITAVITRPVGLDVVNTPATELVMSTDEEFEPGAAVAFETAASPGEAQFYANATLIAMGVPVTAYQIALSFSADPDFSEEPVSESAQEG